MMATGSVHVVGGGLSGLAAAVDLVAAGQKVFLHEAAAHAGGRCRSYHDARLGITIDNGNHLLLSGNLAALKFLDLVGGRAAVSEADGAEFPFIDLATGERWHLHLNAGRLPWWLLDPQRRVPGTQATEYAEILRLLSARKGVLIPDVICCEGLLYDRLWRPILLAALNTDPLEADAGLAAQLLRETFGAGGRACRPIIAEGGLSAAFIDPAMRYLEERGAVVWFNHRLRRLGLSQDRVAALVFGEEAILLSPSDAVILAVPPFVAACLVPDLVAPDIYRGIANIHFHIAPPPGLPRMTGIVNGTSDWLFAYPEYLSVTVSGTDLADLGRQELAHRVWREVSYVTGLYMSSLSEEPPPWQVIRERKATFAATPAAVQLRPGVRTQFANLFVAGDWTDTDLPACIEGAIRSGNTASCAVREAGR